MLGSRKFAELDPYHIEGEASDRKSPKECHGKDSLMRPHKRVPKARNDPLWDGPLVHALHAAGARYGDLHSRKARDENSADLVFGTSATYESEGQSEVVGSKGCCYGGSVMKGPMCSLETPSKRLLILLVLPCGLSCKMPRN